MQIQNVMYLYMNLYANSDCYVQYVYCSIIIALSGKLPPAMAVSKELQVPLEVSGAVSGVWTVCMGWTDSLTLDFPPFKT